MPVDDRIPLMYSEVSRASLLIAERCMVTGQTDSHSITIDF